MATKFQQGGQDDQELFSAYLIKLFKPKSQQEFEDTISKLSEREINEIYKQYKSMEKMTVINPARKIQPWKGEMEAGRVPQKGMPATGESWKAEPVGVLNLA